jgi:CO/xanthine dehydrogenase FAD-binding subunit
VAAGGVYRRPATLAEAVDLLAETPSPVTRPWTVLAGASVYYLNPANDPASDRILDVTGVAELTRITATPHSLRVGAAVTWAALAAATLPPACRALAEAARLVGSVQIQNAGTLGGNLCGAATTADGIPPLLALSAQVELRSRSGTRMVPVADFLVDARRTARRPEELLTHILLPLPAVPTVSLYLKLAQRAYQAPAVVSVAGMLAADGEGRVSEAAFAIGACSSLAKRLPTLERRLIGQPLTGPPLARQFAPADDLAALSPVDDVRVSAGYRLQAAAILIRRAIDRLQADLG